MSSVELTKTYHHLFPVAGFVESERAVSLRPDGRAGAAVGSTAGEAGKSLCISPQSLAAPPPSGHCFGCRERLPVTAATVTIGAAGTSSATAKALGYDCPTCRCTFCASCDELIHSVLHMCPGCEFARGASVEAEP
jgi:transcription initiation factor TFIIH subunit 2